MLTQRQSDILTGLMLGDGHLSIGGTARNPRLRINRSIKDKKYAIWIANEFSNYTTDKCLRECDMFDKRRNITYQRISFNTRRHKDFMPFFNSWYTPTKKVPIIKNLSSLSVAIWFADDGSFYRKSKNGISSGLEGKFSTCGFTKNEVIYLKNLLNNKYNTNFKVYGGYGNDYYTIVGSSRPTKRLILDINDIFPPTTKKDRWYDWASWELNPFCPKCNKDKVLKKGFYVYKKTRSQRFKCGACAYRWRV